MRLYEHEAKKLFATRDIPVPEGHGLFRTVEGVAAASMSYPVMLKAMVLTGGRGKQGGVKKAASAEEATAAAGEILGLTVGGYPVELLFAEAALTYENAAYLGVTTNPDTFNVIVLASPEGGVDIEETARTRPGAVLRREIPDNEHQLPDDVAAEVGAFLAAGEPDRAPAFADVARKLYGLFQDADLKVAEINPLLVTADGDIVAADAKVVVDDNALYRQRKLFRLLGLSAARHDASELTPNEVRARNAGFPYVDLLDPDAPKEDGKVYVGLVPGGAGYGIFSIDETANVGERFFDDRVVPVNFMDSGGGPTLAKVAEMFNLLMDNEKVDLVITSRFGGISSCDVFIRGLVECLRDRRADGRRVLPVSGRMVGTDLPAARAFLEVAQRETPEPLAGLDMVVGNRMIMADVIKGAIEKYLANQS